MKHNTQTPETTRQYIEFTPDFREPVFNPVLRHGRFTSNGITVGATDEGHARFKIARRLAIDFYSPDFHKIEVKTIRPTVRKYSYFYCVNTIDNI